MFRKIAVLCTLTGLAQQSYALESNSVTMYGVVDAGLIYANGGTATMKVNSGVGSTSRIGFTGNENLGNGWYTGFMLESAFQADTGVAGGSTLQGEQSLFNRESNIWIGSKRFGLLKLGRQYPAMIPLSLDPFLGVSGFSPYVNVMASNSDLGRGATLGDSRISNAISYTSPAMAGFMGQILYAPRENNGIGYPRAADYGMEAHYANGNLLYIGGHYNVVNTDPSSSLPSVRNIWSSFGLQYQLGTSILSYELNNIAPHSAGSHVAQNHMLGWVHTPNARDSYQLVLLYRNVAGDRKRNSFTLGFGYSYNLSRSFSIYTRIGDVFNNSGGTSSLSGTAVTKAGNNVSVIALGLRQRF